MNKETEQLLLAFEEWTLFVKTLSRLEEKTWNSSLEKGKWTIKSIVSHMMLWDRYFYKEAIEKIALNQQITLKHLDFDEFNRKAVEYGNRTEPSEIVDKAITYRHKIMNDIRGLSEEQLYQRYVDPENKDNVFYIPQYLKDFIWHDQHHMEPLKQYLAGEGLL
ncbi:DinB family protein [Paenibacillus polysaccharolyticus]|uniref:DinB family protein n=1 Tax=Paenibacillus TaxID=44249 RepID=UPI0016498D23|nr:DinB family protein [Paenibacillus xylanexedens]MCP1134448.1 DinB family protein [Paenibacillus polysaccharolyticus]